MWQLPGPLRIVRQIVAHLTSGALVSFHTDPDWESELRRAVGDALQEHYALLERFYDDAERDPAEQLRSIHANSASLTSTAYWVSGISQERAERWAAEINHLADRQRGLPYGDRLRMVIPLPAPVTKASPGLEILIEPVLAVSRMDLEVMARYLLAGRVEPSGILAILAAISVQLTELLVGTASYQTLFTSLGRWLQMPLDCVGDTGQLASFAEANHLLAPTRPELDLLLWRAQQSVLIGEIDTRRIALICATRQYWKIPYEHQPPHTTRVEEVRSIELLQLGHLAQQNRVRTMPLSASMSEGLQKLKTARDDLSHLKYLTIFVIREVLKLPA